jgi:putative ABC transport system permease protein
MAMGAGFGSIIKQVIGHSAALAGTGIILGLGGAFSVTRLLASLLYGVSATDASTFLITPAVLAAVALVASIVPARRAAGVDPVIALRHE